MTTFELFKIDHYHRRKMECDLPMNRTYANVCKYSVCADKQREGLRNKGCSGVATVNRWQQLHGHGAKVIK